MQITIVSPTRIEIDGQDAGLPLDVFLAREDLRPMIREEFVAWHARHVQEDQARDKAAADKIAEARKSFDDQVAELKADMAILGTKDEAQAMRRAKERNDLIRRLAEIDGTGAL